MKFLLLLAALFIGCSVDQVDIEKKKAQKEALELEHTKRKIEYNRLKVKIKGIKKKLAELESQNREKLVEWDRLDEELYHVNNITKGVAAKIREVREAKDRLERRRRALIAAKKKKKREREKLNYEVERSAEEFGALDAKGAAKDES